MNDSPSKTWKYIVVIFWSLSCIQLCEPMDCSTPGFLVLDYLPEFAQTHVHWFSIVSNHLILCFLRLLLPLILPSIRVFSNESAVHIRWSKYWKYITQQKTLPFYLRGGHLIWWLSGKELAWQFRRQGFWYLGREDPLEKEMVTHSSTLAWEIPWTEEPGKLQFMGSQKNQTQLRD